VLTPRRSAELLVAVTIVVALAALLAPRFAQPESYHHFADQRAWLGIANFGDVTSNVAFAVAGIWGIFLLVQNPCRMPFVETRERWPYVLFFVGLILTAGGSAYYHLAPDNARLVWDRLPMTIAFMSLVSAIIMERIGLRVGLSLLPILLAVGVASVLHWRLSEIRGHSDLRFYVAVQVYAALVVLFALVMQPRYTRNGDLAIVGAFYLAAKILEMADRQVFSLGHLVSGHTLKHLAAAGVGFWLLRMLVRRKALPLSVGS
jgi:hypothetical protein